MKKKPVIHPSNLPSRSPVHTGLFWYLCLEYFNAPSWMYGVMGTVWVFSLINFIYNQFAEEKIDLLNSSPISQVRKTFREKLQEKIRAEQD